MRHLNHRDALPVKLMKYGTISITLDNLVGGSYIGVFDIMLSSQRAQFAISKMNDTNYYLYDPKNLLLERYIKSKEKRHYKKRIPYSQFWLLDDEEKREINR